MLKLNVIQSHGSTIVTCDSDDPDRGGPVTYEYTPQPRFDDPEYRQFFEPMLQKFLNEFGVGLYGHRISADNATPIDLHAAIVRAASRYSEESGVVAVEIVSGKSWKDPHDPGIPQGAVT